VSWLAMSNGDRQHATVRGQCQECEALWLARDTAQIDSRTERLALATRRLITHMQDVIHMDPPPARDHFLPDDYDPERPFGGLTRRPPLHSSVVAAPKLPLRPCVPPPGTGAGLNSRRATPPGHDGDRDCLPAMSSERAASER